MAKRTGSGEENDAHAGQPTAETISAFTEDLIDLLGDAKVKAEGC
jgi:hypothetical protein